jgi:membrane protein YqaA with SNARE-associated domain
MHKTTQKMDGLLEFGYIGLFFGSLLAATIFPFSSDALLLGMLIAGGDPVISVVVATMGNWIGGLVGYWMGWLGKLEWLERWFKVKHETLERHKAKVEKWGPLLALLTWTPFVGDIFAIVLGFYKAKFWPSALWMFVGKCSRYICWAIGHFYVDSWLQ